MKKIDTTCTNLLFGLRSAIDGPFEDVEKVRSEAEGYARKADRSAFVFMEDNWPVGYVEVKLEDTDLPKGCPSLANMNGLGEIARIGVIESARGRGIGTQLLLQAESWLKLHGRSGSWLGYLAKNHDAERLYARNGYIDVAEFMDAKKLRLRRVAVKRW